MADRSGKPRVHSRVRYSIAHCVVAYCSFEHMRNVWALLPLRLAQDNTDNTLFIQELAEVFSKYRQSEAFTLKTVTFV